MRKKVLIDDILLIKGDFGDVFSQVTTFEIGHGRRHSIECVLDKCRYMDGFGIMKNSVSLMRT